MSHQRASLRWKRQRTKNDQNSSYWDESCLPEGLVVVPTSGGTPDNDECCFAEISHQALDVLVALLARKLRDVIIELFNSQQELLPQDDSRTTEMEDNTLSISVAVAIPEGIYLALGVAAAHVLNEGAPPCSVVLVPLDPTEGTERLRRILTDAQPFLVLVATDCDFQTIQKCMTTTTETNMTTSCGRREQEKHYYHVFESSRPLYLAPKTHVVDLRDVVKQIEFASVMSQLGCSVSPGTTEDHKDFSGTGNFRRRVQCCEQEIVDNIDAKVQSCFRPDATNAISHIVYTSGTTGMPKGCISSRNALDAYLAAKNKSHAIGSSSVVLLASAVSFDPCFSDILATLNAGATLFLPTRENLSARLDETLRQGHVSHVLCTPTLWSTLAIHNVGPRQFPDLRVVALGGERIPQHTIRIWARKNAIDETHCRLFSTYGVTEACVYQTMGEVFVESEVNVGLAFEGTEILICQEGAHDKTPVVTRELQMGEIVLQGRQLDAYSAYLRRPDLSTKKFGFDSAQGGHYYRTGDRGLVDPTTGLLKVVGRIEGEHGMVKYNGVRVELGEIEAAIVDGSGSQDAVALDCMVILKEEEGVKDSGFVTKSLQAYVVLSNQCLVELGIHDKVPLSGVVCSGDLLTLLVARCKSKARATPTVFVLIPSIPLTRNGKRDKDSVPCLKDAVPLSSVLESSVEKEVLLTEYNALGAVVADQIVDCLNLLPCQLALLTTSSTFAMLGGDSLTATRVVRALYAQHYNVFNGRELGGAHGVLDDDTFSVKRLLQSKNLGDYVDFLRSKNVCQSISPSGRTAAAEASTKAYFPASDPEIQRESHLYDTLVRSIMQDKTILAVALIEVGAATNLEDKQKFRLSNTRGLQERKTIFHSTPLHLAALKGQPKLVRALLDKNAKFNIPDAAGMFPLHLASSGSHGDKYRESDDDRRLECVKLLLDAGSPLPMKDGNKQTVIHWSARFGYKHILRYFMKRWKEDFIPEDPIRFRDSLDWRDRWSRTPVHWAILNDRIDALRILLENGCSPTPTKPKKNSRTSAALETPQEMCDRLYGNSPKGLEITKLLQKTRD